MQFKSKGCLKKFTFPGHKKVKRSVHFTVMVLVWVPFVSVLEYKYIGATQGQAVAECKEEEEPQRLVSFTL